MRDTSNGTRQMKLVVLQLGLPQMERATGYDAREKTRCAAWGHATTRLTPNGPSRHHPLCALPAAPLYHNRLRLTLTTTTPVQSRIAHARSAREHILPARTRLRHSAFGTPDRTVGASENYPLLKIYGVYPPLRPSVRKPLHRQHLRGKQWSSSPSSFETT